MSHHSAKHDVITVDDDDEKNPSSLPPSSSSTAHHSRHATGTTAGSRMVVDLDDGSDDDVTALTDGIQCGQCGQLVPKPQLEAHVDRCINIPPSSPAAASHYKDKSFSLFTHTLQQQPSSSLFSSTSPPKPLSSSSSPALTAKRQKSADIDAAGRAVSPIVPPRPSSRILRSSSSSLSASSTLSRSPPSTSMPPPSPLPQPLSASAMSDEELARRLQEEDDNEERKRREDKQAEEERQFQALMASEGTCAQCGGVKGTDLVLEIAPCSHRLCADCLRHSLLNSTTPTFLCPVTSSSSSSSSSGSRCASVIPERLMRQVLTAEQLDEVQSKSVRLFLSASSSTYVTCPTCHETFEAVPSTAATPHGGMGVGSAGDVNADGTPLSAAHIEHRNRYRYRCVSCADTNFCSSCSVTPYHIGYTCDEYKQYTNAPHCRYCECALPPPMPVAAPVITPATTTAISTFSRWTRSKKQPPPLAVPPLPPAVPLNVCSSAACQEKASQACVRVHGCGHRCDGIKGETVCLPCLDASCPSRPASSTAQTRDEFCNICYIEALSAAPCIQLSSCGHLFHLSCVETKLKKSWPSARITFYFINCPLCSAPISHPALAGLLAPLLTLRDTVRRMACDRLVFEGCQHDAALRPGAKYHGRSEDYAMDLFAYYMCFKCSQPYFGGRRQCEEAAARQQDEKQQQFDPTELVCGGCVVTAAGSDGLVCAKHGKEFLEYKCKWCCNIAVFLCWGTTHFCADCHKKQEQGDYLTRKPRSELPKCDGKCGLGVKHPPNGEEFALGCGICRPRNAF